MSATVFRRAAALLLAVAGLAYPALAQPAGGAAHPLSIEGLRGRTWGTGPDPVVVAELGLVRGARTSVIEYWSEGQRLRALLQRPDRAPPPGGFPVVVMAHGYVPPDAWTTEGSYIIPSSAYAARGFLVLKPDYRGHGRSGGSAEGVFRTIDYTVDTLELVAKVPRVPGADPGRIYLYGHSMGGEVALRVLALSDAVKAASLWAAVTEPFPENTLYFLRKRDPSRAAATLDRIREQVAEADWPSMSPLSALDRIREPILVHHGTRDESVPYAWAAPFRARLDAAKVAYVFHAYEGDDHNVSRNFSLAMDRDAAFFKARP